MHYLMIWMSFFQCDFFYT